MDINFRQAELLKRWLMVILAGTALLIFFTLVGLRFATAQQATADGSPILLVAEPTPGIIVSGYVLGIDGAGVENVSIYQSLASYPGGIVATTDANGYYRSGFTYIPGDEQITVWAVLSGYVFEPINYSWRHYYGYGGCGCDFLAHLPWLVHIPLVTR